ncbi:MAG: hypothetical protein Q9187_003659 [Circinaria calcarea]
MPKDRERTVNPATAQRKLEKQKALKKGKAAVQAQRTDRLAHRNPERLQRQIDDLKALETSSGKLSARDRKALEDLERDVGRVRKAREAVGDKSLGNPARTGGERGARGGGAVRGGRAGGGGGILGKRRRDREESEGSETDESVRNIPMPRDTPPPIPFQRHRQRGPDFGVGGGNANMQPLGEGRGGGEIELHALPEKPQMVAQTVYEAKPAVRDLRKEAVNRFVPTVVKRKLDARKGDVGGRLLEEEEVEKLEREGYGVKAVGTRDEAAVTRVDPGPKVGELAGGNDSRDLEEEEERFRREMRHVQMEEVDDEDL